MDETLYNFDSRWFSNLPSTDVDAFKQQLISDKNTLDKIKEIVYNIVKSENDVRMSDYDTPNWANKQAHRLGRLDAFNSILRLVTLDGQK